MGNYLITTIIRMEASRVYQFNIGNITIQENRDYNAVAETIDTLNSELDPNAEKVYLSWTEYTQISTIILRSQFRL